MKRFLLLFLMFGTLWSCAEEQDFDQIDDLSIEPTVASSVFYFESDEGSINLATNIGFYQETFTFEAFNEAFIADNVIDGTITYEIANTTSKSLNIFIEFLDADGNVLDMETFLIQEDPAPLLQRQVAYGDDGKSLDILRNTTNIRVRGENLGDSTSVSAQPDPKIILRSSAAFRIRLQ